MIYPVHTDITACPVGQVNTIAMVFGIAQFAERQTAVFYSDLARAFAHVPAARELWSDLAADETTHADELAQLYRELSPDQIASQPAWPLVETAKELRRLVADRPMVITLEDAYQIAHERENSALTTMYGLLGQAFIPVEARKIVYNSRLKSHILKLSIFGRAYGGASVRRQAIARFEQGDEACTANSSLLGVSATTLPPLDDMYHLPPAEAADVPKVDVRERHHLRGGVV